MRKDEENKRRSSSIFNSGSIAINFTVSKTPVEISINAHPSIKVNGFVIFSGSDLDNAIMRKDMKKGILPPHVAEKIAKETGTSKEEVSSLYAAAVLNSNTRVKKKTNKENVNSKRKEWLDDHGVILREKIVEDIITHFKNIISTGDTIYIWDNDRYSEQGEEIITKIIQENLPQVPSRTVKDISNAVANIRFTTKEEMQKMELPGHLIPVRNGLLNSETLQLEPHNSAYFYARRLNVDYKPKIFPIKFFQFLLSRFENNYIEMFKVLEDIGLALLRGNPYQIISIWVGQSRDSSGLISGEEGKTLTAEEIIGEKFFGSELYTRASLQSLSRSDFEFRVLKDRWFHIASLDESGNIVNYSGLLEQLRDPFMEKPVKNRAVQLRWKNTAYNILIGNKFPRATANSKAFYRTIRKIVYWRKPIGEDWKIKNAIDDEEKSGILNLAIWALQVIKKRGMPYGLLSMGETMSKYREISDSLSMIVSQIFEKAPESRIEQNEALSYVREQGEAMELVIENVSKTRLTGILKEIFGVTVEETTENREENTDGTIIKTKKHINYYTGLKTKDGSDHNLKEEKPSDLVNSDTFRYIPIHSDTLQDAVLDYFSEIPNIENIGISDLSLYPLCMRKVKLYYNIDKGVVDSDIPILDALDCSENPEKTVSACVSEFMLRIGGPAFSNRQTDISSMASDPPGTFDKPPNPVNSNARSEIHPITEENGNLVRDQLLALGYHVSSNGGPDINRKFYSIQVIGVLSLPPDMKEKLYHLMHMEHFTLASESQHRALFTRPLIKASDAVIHASPSNPEDLRREVIETVRMESPKSQYGSLTPDAVYKIVGGRFQDIRVAEIKEICEQEYNKGTLIRRGPGYFYNSEGA